MENNIELTTKNIKDVDKENKEESKAMELFGLKERKK